MWLLTEQLASDILNPTWHRQGQPPLSWEQRVRLVYDWYNQEVSQDTVYEDCRSWRGTCSHKDPPASRLPGEYHEVCWWCSRCLPNSEPPLPYDAEVVIMAQDLLILLGKGGHSIPDWVDALTVPLFSEPTVPYDVILCIVGDQRPIFCREPQQKRRRLA